MPRRYRLHALDAFRGLTIAAMIVVNHPGNWLAVFPPLQHAPWNGCTLADLVFPFFIVIMGMALPLTAARQQTRNDPPHGRYRQILWRCARLFALGLLLNAVAAWPDLDTIRIPGVLQRIALTYAIAAPIVFESSVGVRAAIAAALLLLHWALLTLIPVGGLTAGLLTPGHNLAAVIDRAIFGAHLLTPQGDPEGLLGLLPSVATALVGAIAGEWLLPSSSAVRPRLRLVAFGAAAILTGWVWSLVWPLNKTLWSGSYALLSSGLAVVGYVVMTAWVERPPAGRRLAAPLVWLGANPLTLYFGSELLGQLLDRPAPLHGFAALGAHQFIYWRGIAPIVGDEGGVWSSLLFALLYALLWVAVAGLWHRRRFAVQV